MVKAIVYCEGQFGQLDGKTANGLVRSSNKYEIVGIIDSTKEGLDAGEYLDRVINDIPIFKDIEDAILKLNYVPNYFIYGIAPLESFLTTDEREIFFKAMNLGMSIVNGMPEFLNDDPEFSKKKIEYGVHILDIRKPPLREKLHIFSGDIYNIKTPIVAVLGTDCAVGKRTTSMKLVEALKAKGLKVVFLTTGQTGLIQGSKYGIAVDVLSSGFATGEVENEILKACKTENPDIIIVEGQSVVGHPAFTSSISILKGSCPNAIIVQHPPNRKTRCDFPNISMPTLESEIILIEAISKTKVIAITLNHEDMTVDEIKNTITNYQATFHLPTTDVLNYGCEKLINKLFEKFPELLPKKQVFNDNTKVRDQFIQNSAQLQRVKATIR